METDVPDALFCRILAMALVMLAYLSAVMPIMMNWLIFSTLSF